MTEPNETEKTYRRMAMAKVRADVKAYVEKGQTNGMAHLGEYPRTMEDAVRTIIALQDLLETSMDKHKKASDHIVADRQQYEAWSVFTAEIINHAADTQIQMSEEIGSLTTVTKNQHQQIVDQQARIRDLEADMLTMQMEQSEHDDKLSSSLVVLRHALNEGTF